MGLLRRARRRRIDPATLVPLPDSHPKRGLIAEPIRVAALTSGEVETGQVHDSDGADTAERDRVPVGTVRVTFTVEVRSAADARCPAIAVEVVLTGPERERTLSGATDLMGRIRFRMTGPVGVYRCEIRDVGAGGLTWDRTLGPTELVVEAR
jgi:hypothetical protein